MNWKFIWSLLLLIQPIISYKILFICPFPAPSHWLWLEHFARGLLDRGHNVTALTNFKTKDPHENYTEIIIEPKFDIPYYFPKRDIFEMKFNSDFQNLFMWWKVGELTSEHALNDSKVRKLINSGTDNFDLIILEQFFHESFLMFGYKFKAPIITIGTFGYSDNMDHAMGLLTPWSFVPHIVLPYSDNMNFIQRSYNTFLSLFDLFMRIVYYYPRMQHMAERYFNSIVDKNEILPHIRELEKNISMIFINSHRSTSNPRPGMPGLLNVGGAHIRTSKSLPKDIQKFLDEAKQGAIYFSLGSYMKSIEMPAKSISIILETFAKLKVRVLWKYEDEDIPNLPKNVMVKKWLPQNDVLAHVNIRLFITHGGIFGTQEGIFHAVPMLYMPLYGDQHRNSLKSVQEGYALSIDFSKLTVESFQDKITRLLSDVRFKRRVNELSVIFKDNPMHPLDESMYWIEYVIKHNGAKHLKSAAVNLYWWQYILLDVFCCYVLVFIVMLYILYKIFNFKNICGLVHKEKIL